MSERPASPDLSIVAGKLPLRNPVLVASGTGGYGAELMPLLDLSRIGGVVTKTIFQEVRPGNPPQRIAETPAGMLNSIGLEGVGIERFLEEKLPKLFGVDTRVVVSIGGYGPEDFAHLAERLDAVARCDAIELNISCPNVKEGGLDMSTHPRLAAQVVGAVRPRTQKPVWAKLTPNVTRMSDVGKACLDEGADGLSAINTLLGMRIDAATRRPILRRGVGGLSGPAIRPVALVKCWELLQVLRCDVIGMGGIATTEDALEFLIAGCKAVQVGTAVYADPDCPGRIAQGIADYLVQNGMARMTDLVGCIEVDREWLLGPRAVDEEGGK
ncbi:MAG TPA: dihydroorotate dehydrogenase [Candidatus Eisenbacteria bacterium]|nr:dihydroorotate dehydrogenase [Candidatus Eisenbacteria bacterium]